ncbi:MAG: hypothetical protein MJY84_04505 [Bacteroidales bacterium]|nr:hypothetical protein [Bacteroidales bacterium]
MRIAKIIVIAMSSVITVSCGTTKKAQQAQLQQYPNYGGYQPMPGYYQQGQQGVYQGQAPQCQQQYQSQSGYDNSGYVEVKKSPIEELSLALGTNEIRAFGQAESRNEQMALNAARAQAVAALQEKIEVYVRAGLDQYAQETGVNSEYALDESTRNQVMTAAKGVVNGASVLDTRKLYNPNTKRYKYEVCVTYNKAGVIGVMQQQSDRIRANEKKFEEDMQNAWDALDALNNRMSLGEQQQQRQNEMEQNNLDRQHQRDMQYQNQQNQYNLESQRIQGQNQGNTSVNLNATIPTN